MLRQITTTTTSGHVNYRPCSDPPSCALSHFLSLMIFVSGVFLTPQNVEGAEPTVVADAAEERNPFDFIGEVFNRRHLRRAKITREYNCNPATVPEDLETCPDAPPSGKLTNVKELRYARYTHEIVPRARFGLYKDLELWIEMPIVVEDTQEIRFAGDGGDATKVPVTSEINVALKSVYQ